MRPKCHVKWLRFHFKRMLIMEHGQQTLVYIYFVSRNASCPVLAANIDISREPTLRQLDRYMYRHIVDSKIYSTLGSQIDRHIVDNKIYSTLGSQKDRHIQLIARYTVHLVVRQIDIYIVDSKVSSIHLVVRQIDKQLIASYLVYTWQLDRQTYS